MFHRKFKMLSNSTNKHIDSIASQLLTSWARHHMPPPSLPLPPHVSSDTSASHITTDTNLLSSSDTLHKDSSEAIAVVNHISLSVSHRDVVRHVLQI